METNETMVNENVETVEEIATNNGNGLVYVAIGAAILGAGYIIGKKVVKPMIDKHKAKKALEQPQQSDDEFAESN